MAATDWPVTHLFTDLEGSTRLWESEPLRMQNALDRHDALARAIVDRFDGRIVKTTGDGFHAAFNNPVDAVQASVQFACDLAALARELALPLRARCGLHAGLAQAREGDYYGGAINRAARLMNAAHGGQVLVSEAVAALVRGHLPAELTLRGLGRVRLRDLAQPEDVYQLVHPELEAQFPPLRSLDSTPNNLPQQSSSFVGRHGAIAELRKLLASHRLVTIAGAGGIGKTRLALQLAAEVLDEYPDGVWFVDFAPLSEAQLVAETVAQVLSISEQPGVPLAATMAQFLATRRTLLILDNCEHVAAACATMADVLLRGAADVRIITTSREVLRVAGESLYPLHPLSVPENEEQDLAAARRHAGVVLFVERAREHQPSFELTARNLAAVIAICRQLDGMPLALELAAARVRSLPIEEIARRLCDRFRLLATGTRTALPRHQTLAALVAWSYNLLNEEERALFARFAVFAGGFDLESAQAVCGFSPLGEARFIDVLSSLVDKSLVITVTDFEPGNSLPAAHTSVPDERAWFTDRYRMLETIRAFAGEQLAQSGSAAEMARRHAAYFLELAVRADNDIRGASKPRWCTRLTADHDNLRAAMVYVRGPGANPEAALRFGVKLAAYWRFQGHATEGRAHLRAALTHPDIGRFPLSHAGAMLEGGVLASFQGDNDEARALGEASLALYRALGRPSEESSVLIMLGVVLQSSGAFAEARICHEQALAISRVINAKAPQAICLVNLANVDLLRGDAAAARAGLTHALEVLADSGEGTAAIYAHEMLGQLDLREGALLAARDRFSTARELAQRTGDVMQQAKTTMLAGRANVALGEDHNGWRQLADGISRLHRLAQKEETLLGLDMAAEALQIRGDSATATRLRGATSAARVLYKFHWPPLDRAVYERDERDAVTDLSEGAAEEMRRQGASWSLEQAVECAVARISDLAAPSQTALAPAAAVDPVR